MQAKLLSTFGLDRTNSFGKKTKQYQLDSRIEICKVIAIIGKLKKKKKPFANRRG
jgi:hypothetical protein